MAGRKPVAKKAAPKPKRKPKKSGPSQKDWPLILQEWQLGMFSIPQLAERHDVRPELIRKHIRDKKLVKVSAEDRMVAIEAALSVIEMGGEMDEQKAKRIADGAGAALLLSHRERIQGLMFDRVELQSDLKDARERARGIIADGKQLMVDAAYEEDLLKRAAIYNAVIQNEVQLNQILHMQSRVMDSMVGCDKTLIGLQRQAYNVASDIGTDGKKAQSPQAMVIIVPPKEPKLVPSSN